MTNEVTGMRERIRNLFLSNRLGFQVCGRGCEIRVSFWDDEEDDEQRR